MSTRAGHDDSRPPQRSHETLASLAKVATLVRVRSYTIGQAKTQLSKLVRLAEEGEEVIVRRGAEPVARITAISRPSVARRAPGRMRGRVEMHDDFDVWPADMARSLGMGD